jgi:hypothetical protein
MIDLSPDFIYVFIDLLHFFCVVFAHGLLHQIVGLLDMRQRSLQMAAFVQASEVLGGQWGLESVRYGVDALLVALGLTCELKEEGVVLCSYFL